MESGLPAGTWRFAGNASHEPALWRGGACGDNIVQAWRGGAILCCCLATRRYVASITPDLFLLAVAIPVRYKASVKIGLKNEQPSRK